MGAEGQLKPPRVVLDTNIVVSALLFGRGRLAWLRESWQAGHLVPLVDRNTAHELIRVLGYPKFKLTRIEQEALLADFLPFAEVVVMGELPARLPAVRDPCDVMFLALAQRANADVLVSGDADIQAVRDERFGIPILTATDFSTWLAQRDS